MTAALAARVFAGLTLGTSMFQLALAAGAPWGALAWGGAFPGVLPVTMRLASAASVLLLLAFALVVMVRANLLGQAWKGLSRKLIWLVVAYCAVGVVANTLTPSLWERVIWVPVSLLLLASAWVVARSR